MKKTYYEGSITRLLSWPKTTLLGNKFHIKVENSSKFNHNTYYLEKTPRSPSIFLRLIAGLLYPFINPIAFVARKIGTLFSEYQHVKSSQDKFDADLQETLSSLKYEPLSLNFKKIREEEGRINTALYDLLSEVVKTPTAKIEGEFLNHFDAIFKQACVNFMMLNKLIADTIKKEGISDPDLAAKRLVIQRHSEFIAEGLVSKDDRPPKVFAYRFINSSLIDLYNLIRNKSTWEERSADEGDKPTIQPVYNRLHVPKKHMNTTEFYTKGQIEYKWRKMYNTCIKDFYAHPFFQRDALHKNDTRFDRWTRLDRSKEENFIPYPDTKPT